MRRRIYNLANGKFEYEKPELLLSTDRLELKVVEGQNYKGSFTIRSGNGLPLRGIRSLREKRFIFNLNFIVKV